MLGDLGAHLHSGVGREDVRVQPEKLREVSPQMWPVLQTPACCCPSPAGSQGLASSAHSPPPLPCPQSLPLWPCQGPAPLHISLLSPSQAPRSRLRQRKPSLKGLQSETLSQGQCPWLGLTPRRGQVPGSGSHSQLRVHVAEQPGHPLARPLQHSLGAPGLERS